MLARSYKVLRLLNKKFANDETVMLKESHKHNIAHLANTVS